MPRPIKCLFCKGQLHYEGDEGFEPEVALKVAAVYGLGSTIPYYPDQYAHQRCFHAACESTAALLDKKEEIT